MKARAGEFLRDKQWPADFVFLLDPDYRFTNAYGLRWDAKKETAYPATFVLERGGCRSLRVREPVARQSIERGKSALGAAVKVQANRPVAG